MGRTVTVTVLFAAVLLALVDADPDEIAELCETLAVELACVELDTAAEVTLEELVASELTELAETEEETVVDDV